MASTYNFTVRAEDDQGAFADRDFSIVVKNTSVDRYMVVDATDAYTSPDMVNWTKRGSQGGRTVYYGGGQWIIPYGTNGSLTYRLSNDGVTFSNQTINIVVGSGTPTIKHDPVWNSGYWWVMVTGNIDGIPQNALLKSSDGINWILCVKSPNTHLNVNFAKPSFHDGYIYYSPSTTSPTGYYKIDMSLVDHSITANQLIPITLPNPSTYGTYNGYAAPRKINDLWIISLTQANGVSMYYSTDLITWYLEASPMPALANMGSGNKLFDQFTYVNGVIVCHASFGGASTVGTYIFSDDGRNWVRRPNSIITGGTTIAGQRSNVVMTKGKTYFVSAGHFSASSDLGETGLDVASDPAVASQFPIPTIGGFAAIQ